MPEEKMQQYFIDPDRAPKLEQMPGLQTTILAGMHGEQMMMVLNATLPGHEVPEHEHPHEQVGVVHREDFLARLDTQEE
jgi:quercetin dioxygenase-like cupin family protein